MPASRVLFLRSRRRVRRLASPHNLRAFGRTIDHLFLARGPLVSALEHALKAGVNVGPNHTRCVVTMKPMRFKYAAQTALRAL